MPKRMLLHDTRLHGDTPQIAQNWYRVDANVGIAHAVGWVAQYARSQGGLDELIVMCHGYESHENLGNQMTTVAVAGGFGLQLCRENLTLANVGILTDWRGLITKITVYACAAADTARGNEGTIGDGRRFMGEMAIWSGATVIGARDVQTYNYGDGVWGMFRSAIDFGEWEGPVYSFNPNAGEQTPINPGVMR